MKSWRSVMEPRRLLLKSTSQRWIRLVVDDVVAPLDKFTTTSLLVEMSSQSSRTASRDSRM
jgi:hypothetical protein